MCGIAGIIAPDTALVTKNRLAQMTTTLRHRGPDGEGYWINEKGTTGFGHTRLAIIDLSDKAAQPMHYLSRYTIIYNGEIYNYIELKEELQKKGYRFQTQSDTEVILAAYDCYQSACVQHFDGMFAFAIWDDQQQQLFAARDRFGEKPFYYYFDNEQLVFASEMKALWAAGIDRKINEKMFFNYLTLGYTLHPAKAGETFYTGIQKLPARSFLLYNYAQKELSLQTYWDIELNTNHVEITDADAINRFDNLFTGSVKRRLRSDVPVGTSLSGGLDSSSVLASMHAIHPQKLRSFSAVFPGFERDESAYIQMAATACNAESHRVEPTADDIIKNFEAICYHQEEPFQSSGVWAQFFVFELAGQQSVKVLLDGQGADEVLAGYHKYYHWYWQELFTSDKPALKHELDAARNNGITEPWNWKNKLAASFPSFAAMYLRRNRAKKQLHHTDLAKSFTDTYGESWYDIPHIDSLNGVLYYNTFLNGLEELLRYADRNSMAHGTEVRLPFLNHELVQFLFSLPARFKIRDGWTKWLLRKNMETKLPAAITWRKDKVGFEPPQQRWMENSKLQEYVQEAKRALVKAGILKETVLQKKIQPLDAHAAENFDWRYLAAGSLLR